MSLLAIFLKPFVAVIILVPIRVVTEILRTKMPDSKLKRVLFLPLPGQSRSRR